MKERAFEGPLNSPAGLAGRFSEVDLDFGHIFSLIRKGWWIVALGAILGGLLAAVMVLRVPPTFQATSQILLGEQSGANSTLDELFPGIGGFDDAKIAGEIAIITSGRVLAQVSERLDLENNPVFNVALRPPEPEPPLPVQWLDQSIEWFKGVLGGGEEEVVEVEADPGNPNPIVDAAVIGRNQLGDEVDYVEELAKGLVVDQVGSTNLVDIEFYSTDRLVSAAVANTLADVYLDEQLTRKFEDSRRLTDGLNQRLEIMRDRLESAERAVIDYRNSMLSDGLGTSESMEQQLRELSVRLSTVSAEYAEVQSELEAIDALIASDGVMAAAGQFDSPLLTELRAQIAELRQRRELWAERFGEQTPQVRDTDEEIAAREASLTTEVDRLRNDLANRAEVAAGREAALEQRLREQEQMALDLSERQVTMTQLERDLAGSQLIYETFLNRFIQTSEVVNLQQADAQIVAYADPPANPVAPRKKLAAALGMVAGASLGLAVVFLRAYSDTSIKTISQLRRALGGAHVMALPRQSRLIGRSDPLKFVQRWPHSPLSEAIGTLRANVLLSAPEHGQVVAVMSCRPLAGKTTTSLLLARSAARMGKSCIVVDTDLRRGGVARVVGHAERPDLIDVLDGTTPLEEALRQDEASGFYILNARTGLKDPAGALLSKEMTWLVKKLRSSYDLVVLDTAPLLPVSDAIPMAQLADNLVFLVRQGATTTDEIDSSLRLLGKAANKVTVGVLSMSSTKGIEKYEYY